MEVLMERSKEIEDLEKKLERSREQLSREVAANKQAQKEARTLATKVAELQLEVEILKREVRVPVVACACVGLPLRDARVFAAAAQMDCTGTSGTSLKGLLASARLEVGKLLAEKQRMLQELERYRSVHAMSGSMEDVIGGSGTASPRRSSSPRAPQSPRNTTSPRALSPRHSSSGSRADRNVEGLQSAVDTFRTTVSPGATGRSTGGKGGKMRSSLDSDGSLSIIEFMADGRVGSPSSRARLSSPATAPTGRLSSSGRDARQSHASVQSSPARADSRRKAGGGSIPGVGQVPDSVRAMLGAKLGPTSVNLIKVCCVHTLRSVCLTVALSVMRMVCAVWRVASLAQINGVEAYFSPGDVLLTSCGWKDPNAVELGDNLYRSKECVMAGASGAGSDVPSNLIGVIDSDEVSAALGARFVQVQVLSVDVVKIELPELTLAHRRHGFVVANVAAWDGEDRVADGFGSNLEYLEVLDHADCTEREEGAAVAVPLPRHLACCHVKKPEKFGCGFEVILSSAPFQPGINTPNMLGL